jgi:lysophospholipase L1-like esterase
MSRVRVCFVGDSITSGQGDSRYLGWPRRIGTCEAAAAKLYVPYLDVFHALSAEPAWLSDELIDGVHPNARGYDRMADLFCDWAI